MFGGLGTREGGGVRVGKPAESLGDVIVDARDECFVSHGAYHGALARARRIHRPGLHEGRIDISMASVVGRFASPTKYLLRRHGHATF